MKFLIYFILTCFLFFSQSLAQITWTKIHQFNGARVYELVQTATDSLVFYANVADAGIWKSTDAGLTWSSTGKLNTYSSHRGLTVSPFNENCVIFVSRPGSGAESGVFICTDGGGTWSNIENQFGSDFPLTVEFSPSDSMIVYAAGDSSIYKSSDGGFTWTLQNFFSPLSESINDIKVDLNNSNRLIIGTRSQIAISNDAGISWQTASFDYTISFISAEIDVVNDTLMASASWEGLLISYDNGNNWHGIAVPAGGNPYPGYSYVTVDRSNLNHILLSSYNYGIMESYDGGNSWLPFSAGLPSYFGTQVIRSVSSAYSKIVVSGYDCGLYYSENGGIW